LTLTQRERYIHYLSVLSCFGIMEHIPREVIVRLADDIRKERCRKLTDTEIEDIISEMRVEQMSGKSAMDEIMRKGFGDDYKPKHETREDWR